MSDLIESAEALREALLTLRQEHEALQAASAQAEHLLAALESLLVLDDAEDPFVRVFAALRSVFTFSSALMLHRSPEAGDDDALECIVADPVSLVGTRWPLEATSRKALGGRVVATLGTGGGAAGDSQAALHIPVRVRERRAILVLLRPVADGGFDREDVALGRRLSLLVSHALATRFAHQSEAEGQRLMQLSEQLHLSEQAALRNAALLKGVVAGLPLGLTVQDANGRLLIINEPAAQVLGQPVDDLLGRESFDLEEGGACEVLASGRRFEQQLHSQTQHSSEHEIMLAEQPRTLMVTSKPLEVVNDGLLLTTLLDITERKRFERELAQRAFHDELTGLPNRALIQEMVTAELSQRRPGESLALAFIDLDHFKQVNDFYSHAVGDELLRAVADRVRGSIRPSDTLARISGDEFLLLINPLERAEDLRPLIDRVIDALKQPFQIEGHELLTSASVGAAVCPLHGTTYEALRRSADHAMYQSKLQRKGGATYFEDGMACVLSTRMDLEQRLRSAIRHRHFQAAYQPKVDIVTGAVRGFEALMRWVEPDGKVHMPGAFIELATELGLLDELTHFMLDDVIAQLPRLSQRFGDAVTVSLNIGARQAGDLHFMDSLIRRIDANLGRQLVLELTEDALVAAHSFQKQVLPRLRELGVRVSIDDFGTGYSSLEMLSDVIADEVKVDRAFISAIQQRPRSQGILRAIESLCGALQIDMVAEGVETPAELDHLRKNSAIRCAQGYIFARPLFVEEILHPDWVTGQKAENDGGGKVQSKHPCAASEVPCRALTPDPQGPTAFHPCRAAQNSLSL